MSTIDMTHRKLNFPPRFLPYLEKHRIFELLHECVELLVQVRPKDHIEFLKNVLPCAAMKKDKQRIVFLSPFSFVEKKKNVPKTGRLPKVGYCCPNIGLLSLSSDAAYFSELLADCLGIQRISKSLLEFLTRERQEASAKVEEPEISEEESCICPGEGEGSIPRRLYYPPGAEDHEYFYDSEWQEGEEEEEVEEEAVKEEEPCICVCPCIKKQEEEATAPKVELSGGSEEDGQALKEEGQASKEEGEDGEYYPCEPREKRKHRKHRAAAEPMVSAETSEIEQSALTSVAIDYSILAECEQSAKGWILEDYAKSEEEAELLNSLGVIPTHAIRIIVDEVDEEADRTYKATVKGWMRAYKYVPVMEIKVGKRTLSELVSDMCSLLSVMPHRHPPMLPRVVLIGSRGAGVTTQGEKLARKYGLVHVEFDLVISRALQQDDEMCKMYKLQLATRPDPELEALLLERALLTPMCRNRGWVLTGYPTNVDQMRMLDIIATPPNRVIFIEVPARECFVRLYYRKTDPCLGDEYKIPIIQPLGLESYEAPDLEPEVANRLLTHPKNNKKQIISDIEKYFLCKTDMMMYCGKTASIVNGNQEVDRVFEQIEQVLLNPAPAQPPRDPLAINHGIEESYERLKKFRLAPGMFFNNMLLNPPRRVIRI